jgi:hypothetical protein
MKLFPFSKHKPTEWALERRVVPPDESPEALSIIQSSTSSAMWR